MRLDRVKRTMKRVAAANAALMLTTGLSFAQTSGASSSGMDNGATSNGSSMSRAGTGSMSNSTTPTRSEHREVNGRDNDSIGGKSGAPGAAGAPGGGHGGGAGGSGGGA